MARNGNAPTTTKTDTRGGKSMSDDKDTAKEVKQAAEKVAGVNEPAVTQYVQLAEIHADEARNVRVDYGPEDAESQGSIAKLADDIADNGQLTPLIVSRRTGGGYDLIAGFRRFRALRLIETQTKAGKRQGVDPVLAWVQIRKPDSEVDALYLNWDENLQRKDLTPFENAREAAMLVKDHGEKAGDIAKRVKLDRKYVDNMIRVYNGLDPRIVELWGKGHARATWSFVLSIAAQSHTDQWQAWREHIGEIDAEGNPVASTTGEGNGEGAGEGEGTANAGTGTSRPSVSTLESAMRYVRDSDKPDGWKKGALAALQFAAGQTERIPAVYDPKKAKEAEREAAKAEKAAAKAAEKAAADAAKAKAKAPAKGGRPTASA